MKSNYNLMAKIYDPIFYLPLKSIRIAVMNELLKYKEKVILDLYCGTGNQIKLLSKNTSLLIWFLIFVYRELYNRDLVCHIMTETEEP